MSTDRSILHVDMDAFFASIEQLDNPQWRGKPLLVGHDGLRGVVSAASYEARRFGCRSAQPMAVARRLCPSAIVAPVRGGRYHEVSQQIFSLFDDFSPLVEPLSVDEAFLDLTGCQPLLGSPLHVARRIKDRIQREIGITASVGIAPNKFLAKLASDLEKPDGLVTITPETTLSILAPLPVTRLWGVGPATAARLQKYGITTIGDVQRRSIEQLTSCLGNEAEWFHQLAHGIDDRPVTPDRQAKSIGQEQTFGLDCGDPEEVGRILFDQVEQVARRLRKHELFARTVTLKIRYGDFETITRSRTLKCPTSGTAELWEAASGIFREWSGGHFRPVRLIGVTAAQLGAGEAQLSLFADPQKERQKKLDALADVINARFGKRSIRRGGGMEKGGEGDD